MELIRSSQTSEAIIQKWWAEVNALPPKKRPKWKGKLWDKWNVGERVRFVPEGREIAEGVVTHFEVWKQPNRDGGDKWWPVLGPDAFQGRIVRVHPLSEFGARMMNADDMFQEFNDIQGETHTGNHYRNHSTKVPTQSGEPVRG